jgi:hypothetical protein
MKNVNDIENYYVVTVSSSNFSADLMNGKLTDSIISDRDQNPDYHVA